MTYVLMLLKNAELLKECATRAEAELALAKVVALGLTDAGILELDAAGRPK